MLESPAHRYLSGVVVRDAIEALNRDRREQGQWTGSSRTRDPFLVVVELLRQMSALRPGVRNFKRKSRAQVALNREVVTLQVPRWRIGVVTVRCQNAAQRT